MELAAPQVSITTAELVQLCAVDNALYEKTFFPKTVRQAPPPFHREMDELLASNTRYIAFQCFRGSAKTSKFRMFISKQIAYGVAHTILLVSNSQSHSIKSLEWLKRNVEFNTRWARTFGLTKGNRWSGEDIEIIHGVDEYPIRVLALGITGQVRGVNIDDFRPDLIGVDDPDNEETTGSAEQIKKTADLFFGALGKSLAPPSEAPHAKMVLMQTPLVQGDLVTSCEKDEAWVTVKFSCFDANGKSAWPARFSTEFLLKEKEAHVRTGRLALWMREMECEIIPEGGATFNPENLKYWDLLPDRMVYLIAIDPASSESKTADDQVIAVIGFHRADVYLVEYTAEKGEMPEKAITTVIEYIVRYKPLGIISESIGYQRVLAHAIEQKMRETRRFVPVHRIQDQRRKADRIIQAVGGAAGYGRLYVRPTMSKFLTQYGKYSPLARMHDDVLDALAMGIDYGISINVAEWGDWVEGEYSVEDERQPKQLEFRSCP